MNFDNFWHILHHNKVATREQIVGPPHTVCVTTLVCKISIMFPHRPTLVARWRSGKVSDSGAIFMNHSHECSCH